MCLINAWNTIIESDVGLRVGTVDRTTTEFVRLVLLHRSGFWLCYHFSLKIIFLMLLATLEFPKPPQTGYFGNFRQFSTILATIEAISWIAFLRFWRFEIFVVNCQIKLVPNKNSDSSNWKVKESAWVMTKNKTVWIIIDMNIFDLRIFGKFKLIGALVRVTCQYVEEFFEKF